MSKSTMANTTPKVISRHHLIQWLDQIGSQISLIAPREVDGIILYRQVAGPEEIAWKYNRPVLSAKSAFFPPTERLFTFEPSVGNFVIEEPHPTGDQVMFGVRPCDAHGLQALDALFISTEPSDTYYAQKRDMTTLVGLACSEIGPTCFCTAMGGAPNDTRNLDLMLTEVDGEFLLQVITDKGQTLIDKIEPAGVPYAGKEIQVIEYPPPVEFVYPKLDSWPSHFTDSYWQETAERCLSCRLCAYVCPTCRCFDVRDAPLMNHEGRSAYERIRCWDSCSGESYRRIAGGHNPRPAQGQRLRNRFYCKFYYFPLQYGPTACIGCGRCIDVCPVGVDITEVIQHLAVELTA